MTRVELENIVPPPPPPLSPHPNPQLGICVCGRAGGTQFSKPTDSTQNVCPSQICLFTQMIYIYFSTIHILNRACARARPASCNAPVKKTYRMQHTQYTVHITYQENLQYRYSTVML
jgi:hypothetical protein